MGTMVVLAVATGTLVSAATMVVSAVATGTPVSAATTVVSAMATGTPVSAATTVVPTATRRKNAAITVNVTDNAMCPTQAPRPDQRKEVASRAVLAVATVSLVSAAAVVPGRTLTGRD